MSERPASTWHRFQIERKKLVTAWHTIAIDEQNGLITNVVGSIEAVPGSIRDFQIIVPKRYPYEPPRAFPIGWTVQGPHSYENNEMCLWRPNSH